MGIRVECPNGHKFKVKDKYAGKKGLCPHCTGKQVVIRVPESIVSKKNTDAYRKVVADEIRHHHEHDNESVLDDTLHDDASSSGSLLSSSVIRHNIKCSCGQGVPLWFARCPGCGKYLDKR